MYKKKIIIVKFVVTHLKVYIEFLNSELLKYSVLYTNQYTLFINEIFGVVHWMPNASYQGHISSLLVIHTEQHLSLNLFLNLLFS